MTEIIRETTVWDVSFRVQNHTYLLDARGYILAYAKSATGEITELKGKIRLDKRRRSFIRVKHDGLASLVHRRTEKKSTRTFKVTSKDKEYFVEFDSKKYSCTCTGFTFRGKCKHITAVMEKLK
jgi:hypothetical protein